MLLVLHMGLMVGVESGASRAFLLAHFGLFLLWQPLWQGARRLVPVRALAIVAGGAALAWWSSWWTIGLWIAVLFSLIGGNVPGMRELRPRLAPLLAALYLLSILLVWVVPHLIQEIDVRPVLGLAVRYGMALPLLAILAIPGDSAQQSQRYAVDLVYSVLLFLLVVVLVLGALVVQQITKLDYPVALVQTVVGIAMLMLILSWLWDPRGSFDGIGQLLSRYFLSLGMPFERWMHSLANLAEHEPDPDSFVAKACEEMVALPWVSAVEWRTGGTSGSVGVRTDHVTSLEFRGLDLRVHSQRRPGPGMIVHMRLLARLLGDFYDAKVREQMQRQTAYLQAIYETGSRVTHDVKNLLQSLHSLCAAVEAGPDTDPEGLRSLIQRQLPQITQRLQVTLDKLDSRQFAPPDVVSARDWWWAFRQRHAHEGIEFEDQGLNDIHVVPVELFDSVSANLLQNALDKRRRGESIVIRVTLRSVGDAHCALSVTDSGEPVPAGVVNNLFSSPVRSDTGLGVGLFQGGRQATALGYRLDLMENRAGCVTFTLTPRSSRQEPGFSG